MTALPAAGYFSNPARINSEAKTAQDDILAWLRQSALGAAGAPTTLTLATDTITPTGAVHLVDTEGAAATDTLSTIAITNTVDGQLLLLTGVSDARLVTVNHGIGGTGQILLQDDTNAVLDSENHILLRRSGNNWIEVARSHGADQVFWCGTAGGTANALTASPNITIPAYRTGMTFLVIAASASTSGTVTLNVQSFGTKNIKKIRGTGKVALGSADIIAGGLLMLVYDGTDMIWANAPRDTMGADVASAGTMVFDTATGNYFNVTGTTTCTAITLAQGQRAYVKFGGIMTLTNGASLINLGGANIATAAGDTAEFVGEASGVVRMLSYSRAAAFTSGVLIKGGGGNLLSNTGINIGSSNEIDGYLAKFRDEVGTTYSTVDGDTGKIITFNNGSAITVTLHKAAPVGTCITWNQKGAGQVTFQAESGGSMVNRSSHTKSAGQNASGSAYVRSNAGNAAVWVLNGDTSA